MKRLLKKTQILQKSYLSYMLVLEGWEMPKGKILVVDDEPKIVSTVRAYLERDGYEVLEANDGKQALESLPARTAGFDYPGPDAS